jgi:hypothetical protein
VQEVEDAKVSVRSVRKQGMVAVKQLASEDDRFRAEREVGYHHFPRTNQRARATAVACARTAVIRGVHPWHAGSAEAEKEREREPAPGHMEQSRASQEGQASTSVSERGTNKDARRDTPSS